MNGNDCHASWQLLNPPQPPSVADLTCTGCGGRMRPCQWCEATYCETCDGGCPHGEEVVEP